MEHDTVKPCIYTGRLQPRFLVYIDTSGEPEINVRQNLLDVAAIKIEYANEVSCIHMDELQTLPYKVLKVETVNRVGTH